MIEIYYIEDDECIAMAVKEYLSQKGYAVSIFGTLESGKKALEHHIPSIALIDWNMPDGEGNSFCRWIRSRWKELPVIFLTVRDDTCDIISGFEYGADDYVTKPFSMKVLLKKISVLLSKVGRNPNVYDDGFLKIDFELGLVHAKQKDCSLTPTEYRILKKLIDNKGQLLTYSTLLDSLWEEGVQLLDKHALAVNINRLRKKIETEERTYISNVYGMGYIWK